MFNDDSARRKIEEATASLKSFVRDLLGQIYGADCVQDWETGTLVYRFSEITYAQSGDVPVTEYSFVSTSEPFDFVVVRKTGLGALAVILRPLVLHGEFALYVASDDDLEAELRVVDEENVDLKMWLTVVCRDWAEIESRLRDALPS